MRWELLCWCNIDRISLLLLYQWICIFLIQCIIYMYTTIKKKNSLKMIVPWLLWIPDIWFSKKKQYIVQCVWNFPVSIRRIPHICLFFYTSTFWGLKILRSKVRKFATKIASRQKRKSIFWVKLHTVCVKLRTVCQTTHCVKNYTMCVKLHTVWKITQCVKTYTLCVILHAVRKFTHCV